MSVSLVVLAGGKGSRMLGPLHKLEQPILGKKVLDHIVDCAKSCMPEQLIIVHHPSLKPRDDIDARYVAQVEALGTGHAVLQAMPHIPDHHQVVVIYADVPLVPKHLIQKLCQSKSLCLLTTTHPNPQPFGRILKNDQHQITGVVEAIDATDQEKEIKEIFSGMLSAPAAFLKQALPKVKADNQAKEYYLPSIVPMWHQGPIESIHTEDYQSLQGVNTLLELNTVERYAQYKQACALIEQGLDIVDPKRFDLRGKLTFGKNCRIEPNVMLEGPVHLGEGVYIGANCQITSSLIGDHTQVFSHSVLTQVELSSQVKIGPFAHLRPGTVCGQESKIGAFVETKATSLGAKSKIPHLSYIGDAHIGQGVNIGAGVITCNYDGKNKYPTHIEDGVFVGSGTQLVAPIKLGQKAYIGAGTTLRNHAKPGSLTLTAGQEKVIHNWKTQVKDDA